MKKVLSPIGFLAIILVCFFSSCKQNKDITPSIEFAPYINAYTGGLVSTGSTIRIELTQEQPSVELYAEVKDKLFDFNPSLKGKAYWINNKTIEFVPDSGQLVQGKLYNAEFKLNKIIEVEKKLKTFDFSFRVIEQNFALEADECAISADNPNMCAVNGEIRFCDNISLDDVKKLLSAKIGLKSQTMQINPAADNKSYKFSIEHIERTNEDKKLIIKGNGKEIGIDKSLDIEVEIPALEPFRYISAKPISQPENGIQVVFSDPVSQSQDLRGLISIPEINSYVYQVEGNKVNVFFEQANVSTLTVQIDKGVKNTKGNSLSSSSVISLAVESLKPQVEMPYSGSILPDSKNLILPFRAVNLSAVDVKIIRIFESNVLMFMQTNGLDGSNELRRSGRLVYMGTFQLDNDPTKKLYTWDDYHIDLANIIKQEPGAIYRIELSFKQEFSLYPCSGKEQRQKLAKTQELTKIISDNFNDEEEEWDEPEAYYDSSNIDWSVYNWEEVDDPCKPSYYMTSDKKAMCNVLASNIGIIVKGSSDNRLWVAVNDILTTEPITNAELKVYNFQLQVIGTAKTDGNGFAVIESKGKPFVIVAESNHQKTYLKLVEGEEKSLSRFDVGGKEIKKGLKGFVYGERGVWRPGDTLHIGFIMEDKHKKIPDDHPVAIEIYNPQGQFYAKQISTKGLNGFYTFDINTKQEDPTGLWNAYVKVGGATFHKSLRIETVKPNRLKINLQLPGRIDAYKGNIPVTLTSSWLTGATARNLKTKVEMSLSKVSTQFKGYDNYIFNNPATNFVTNQTQLFEGKLNEGGNAYFDMKVPDAKNAPGMLQANIICRVFEQGGDASIYTQSVPFSPFSSYVGINLNQKENDYLETDKNHTFDIITLSPDGKPTNRQNLDYKIYKLSWSWWWENSGESFESYVNSTSVKPVDEGKLNTSNGKGKINFRINYPDWGRYLIYVKDTESGHATGGIAYVDWPDWRGRSQKSDPNGITMLSFSTDKKSYEVGEEVTVIVPAASNGKALLALENGSTVLKREWINVKEGEDTKYVFKVTEDMAPNFYVHISLLQPHAQTVNNLPIRMYGVVSVSVTNKNSQLSPQITMPDVLRPETEFTVKVNEKNGKPMTYTLAIVDDGLLDLTNFKTPNPWNEFYSHEALGIKTWDMYDYVIGAFGGKCSSLFSVGGDEMLKQGNEKANRFKPVVKFIGPFVLKKGATETHKITLPMYVGSVRVMVVAGQDGAYGNAEKTVPVRTPLMVLSTLPRVISTGEEILLPVNVFAMENNVKNATIKVETSGKLQLTDGNTKSVSFAKPGDEMVFFKLKSGSKTGKETVKITATGNGNNATETIEIDVRNPNPPVINIEEKLLSAGSSGEFSYQLGERSDDNWVNLEVSRIPSVDISRRFDFLYDYQHDCSEQLTSKAFPLLYVSQFKDVSEKESESIKQNIREAIKKLYGRQLPNGGFVYWPGQADANEWITSYAGKFLIEAQQKGFEINQGVLNKWKDFQRRAAQNWSPSYKTESRYSYNQYDLQQAYRLYTLALAGSAELGAMNRMKEMKDLSVQAKWRLAATYAINGKTKAANELIWNAQTSVQPYSLSNFTYGSSYRDDAMILETMVLMGNMQNAIKQAKVVSQNLSSESYFSTQSTAFALVAMGHLAEKTAKGFIDFEWTLNGKAQNAIKSAKAVYQISVPINVLEGKITLRNKGQGDLFVSLVSKTQPVNDTLPEVANNLKLDISYTDLSGNSINIYNLNQGTDFNAVVKISNISGTTDYTDLALTHIVPSGWEIFNERMLFQNEEGTTTTSTPNYIYRDIRDDRVLTYFDLGRSQSKTFTIRLQAAYIGSFVLPAIQCEAMYDTQAQARTRAGRVNVGN